MSNMLRKNAPFKYEQNPKYIKVQDTDTTTSWDDTNGPITKRKGYCQDYKFNFDCGNREQARKHAKKKNKKGK